MTLSRQDLKEDEQKLLRELVEKVGDQYVGEVAFDAGDQNFHGYLRASFPGLVRRNFARIVGMEFGDRFQLTPRGWMIGIKRGEFGRNPDFAPAPEEVDERIIQVVKTLKELVAGRDNFVPVRVLASDAEAKSGVSRGWIRNSIQSHLLQYRMPNKDLSCSYNASTQEIVIPQTFQHPR